MARSGPSSSSFFGLLVSSVPWPGFDPLVLAMVSSWRSSAAWPKRRRLESTVFFRIGTTEFTYNGVEPVPLVVPFVN